MAADRAHVAVTVRWVALDELDERTARACCTPEELATAARRATPLLRRRAVASVAARRMAVGEVLGAEPGSVALLVEPDGRRMAAAHSGYPVAISVSTCGPVGLVAVASAGAVGADVEELDVMAATPTFVARVASPAERTALAELDAAHRDAALLGLWTRKEAYLKATGEGIGAALAVVTVPISPGVWAERFEPRDDCIPWWCFDLAGPTDRHAAAVVVGTVRGGATSELEVTLAVRAL